MQESKGSLELQVKRFHEACRITSKYEDLKDILAEIDSCLEEVSSNVANIKLRESLKTLLPIDKSDRAVKPIILWCLAQGYLQQAVTMTAEWFPRYALAAGVFKIVDPQVEEENDQQRQPWDTWTGNLFKNYNPYTQSPEDPTSKSFDLEAMTSKDLRNILKNKNFNYWEIYITIKGHNKKLEEFLIEIMTTVPKYPRLQFPQYLVALSSSHPLRRLFDDKFKNVSDEDLQRYIAKGLKNSNDPAEYVLSILAASSRYILVELFDLQDSVKPKRAKTDEETLGKIAARKKIFENLLQEGKIASSKPDVFLEIVEKQISIIEFYRNRMNHGVIKFEGIVGNKEIEAKVEELFNLSEELEA